MAWTVIGQAAYSNSSKFTHAYDTSKYNYRARYAQPGEDITIMFSPGSTHRIIPSGGHLDINSFVLPLPNNTTVEMITSSSYVVYVEREEKNTAPTIPGAFTQPTGTLETGDAKVVSWGASSDAESNLSKYVLEA